MHSEPSNVDASADAALNPPTVTVRRNLLLSTAAVSAAALLAFLLAGPSLPAITTAVPAVLSFGIVAALGGSWLLSVYDEGDRDPALRWIAQGSVVAALCMLLAILAFPTLLPTGALLPIGPNGIAALYLSWKLVLGVMALLGVSRVAGAARWRRVAVVAALALTVLAAWSDGRSGPLVDGIGRYTPTFRALLTVVTVVVVVATWRWVASAGREATWPRAWVSVALGLHAWDLVLYGFAERRFSIPWWAGLGTRLAAFSVLAIGLLVGLRRVFRTLDRYAARLGDVAVERTAAATELAAANDELQAFAHVVAHDLRTPLTAASGYVGLARSAPDPLPPDVADLLDRAGVQHRRMASLITDLLEFAEVANAHLQREWTDLGFLAREVIRDRAAETVVDLDVLPAVLGDPGRLRQLLDNLVGNAIKYVPPGVEPHVWISTEAVDDDTWAVHVDDNGIGIEADRAAEIFRPFVRGTDARAGYPGTGIGLAICQRVVEQHGGTIHASPRAAGGSRFTFTLPRAASPAADPVDAQRSPSPEGQRARP
ncbi:MAG TPA: HAMP domain-containing sensor histidine kinase [Egicoccus sp.]|nr:HAMP domain-containing sensor histidine kinase [Egicoccus sp.]HSK22088.1 HAMP domain-containing sensor histidine kinase [Egicoccus sp.]